MAEPIQVTLEVLERNTRALDDFGRNVDELSGRIDEQGRTTERTTGRVREFGASLGRQVAQVATFGAALLGLQAGFGAISSGVQALRDFDSALAQAGTQGINSQAQLQRLRQEILALPPALGSSTELAQGLYAALSSGIPAEEAVRFVGNAAVFAQASYSNLEDAVNNTVRVLQIYGSESVDAARVTDVLTGAIQLGQFRGEAFAGQFTVVAGTARQLGLSFEETTATLARLSTVFPSLNEAATGFRSLLNSLISNAQSFRDAGIDVNRIIGEQGFTGLLRVLQERTGGSAEALRNLGLADEALNAALQLTPRLLQQIDEGNVSLTNTSGQAAQAFRQSQATFDAALTTFQNTLDRFIQEQGPGFLSAMTSIVQTLTTVFPQAIQFATTAWDAFTFAIAQGQAIMADIIGALTAGASAVTTFAASVLDFFGASGVAARLRAHANSLEDISATWQEIATEARASAESIALGTDRIVEGARRAAIEQRVLPNAFRETGTAAQQMATDATRAQRETADAARQQARRLEVVWVSSIERVGDIWTTVTRSIQREARATTDTITAAFADLNVRTIPQLDQALSTVITRFTTIQESGLANLGTLRRAFEEVADVAIERYGTLPPAFQQVHDALAAGNREAAARFLAQWDEAARRSAETLEQNFRQPTTQRVQEFVTTNQTAAVDIAEAHEQAARRIRTAYQEEFQNARGQLDALRQGLDDFIDAGIGPITEALPGDETTIEGVLERIIALQERIAGLQRSTLLTPTEQQALIVPLRAEIGRLTIILERLRDAAANAGTEFERLTGSGGTGGGLLDGAIDGFDRLGGAVQEAARQVFVLGSGINSLGGLNLEQLRELFDLESRLAILRAQGGSRSDIAATQERIRQLREQGRSGIPGVDFVTAPTGGGAGGPGPSRPVFPGGPGGGPIFPTGPQRPTFPSPGAPGFPGLPPGGGGGDSIAIGIPGIGDRFPIPGAPSVPPGGGGGGVLLPPTIVIRMEAGAISVRGTTIDAQSLSNEFVSTLTRRLEEEQRRGRLRVGG